MSNRVYYIGPADTLEAALDRFRQHQGFIAADCETVSTTDKRIIGIGFATSPSEGIYFAGLQDNPDSQHYESPYFQEALTWVLDPRLKVWFNNSFDLEVLDLLDPTIPWDKHNWGDLSIACRIQAMHNSLDMNAGEYLGVPHTTIQDILPKGKNMLSLGFQDVAEKCIHDCMVTWWLASLMDFPRWHEGREEGYTWYDRIERPMDVTSGMIRAYQTDRQLIPLLRKMGKTGLRLNTPYLREQYTKLAKEKFFYQDICQRDFGFNPGSNQQTGLTLAMRENFLPWTKGGKYKTLAVDGDTLSGLDDPLAYIVLEYRKRADRLSDVIEPLLGKPPGEKGKKVLYKDWVALDRFTTHFKLDLATSRLSSYGRNIQNITPELREMFIADNGTYTWYDANQIEYRIFGQLSQEPNIINAYRDGINVHELSMKAVWPGQERYLCCGRPKCLGGHTPSENPLYTAAKTGNYSVIYFVEAATLSKTLKRPISFCEEFIRGWRTLNPQAVKWMEWAAEEGLNKGWVPTLEGRRCRLPDPLQQGEEHTAKCGVNYRIQGSAAWPIKVALLKFDKDGYDQRVQLHDEVVCDGDYYEELVHSGYELDLGELTVPIEVKQGPVWV